MTTAQSNVATTYKEVFNTWAMLLAFNVGIALLLFFFAGHKEGAISIKASYEIWFLVVGLASSLATLPLIRRFREATQLKPGAIRDAEYWQNVSIKMFGGFGIASTPLYIGIVGYMLGGFTRTMALLLIVSITLHLFFKPTADR